MPTYNAEEFLEPQLSSLLSQTLLPTELIVFDDASQDGTVSVLRAFAASAPFEVRIVESPTNMGWARALRRAVSLATADLVAFADQDDIWLRHKLERAAAALVGRHGVEAVAADSLPFRADSDQEQRVTVWQSVLAGKAAVPDPLLLARRNFVTAHNLVVRREPLARYLWPDRPVSPDYWLALVFSSRGSLLLIDEPLVRYRLHPGQAFGLTRGHHRAPNRAAWETTARTIEEFVTYATSEALELEAEVVAALESHVAFLRDRAGYVSDPRHEWRRLVRLLQAPGAYGEFAHGRRSLAADVGALFQFGVGHG